MGQTKTNKYGHVKANSKFGHKDVKLTAHSKMRAEQRLGLTSSEEIRKLAISAKYKGISVRALTTESCNEIGIGYDGYRKIKSQFAYHSNNDRLYYYKDAIFVFGGNKSLVLKTIINLNLDKHEEVKKERIS